MSKKEIFSNYQKKVLMAYQKYSPSKIDLSKYKLKYNNNLKKIFYNQLKLDKNFFKNKTILDLGCGTGETDFFMASQGAKYIVGVDFNYLSIKQANIQKKKFKIKNISFKTGDIVDYQPKNKFDIIICKGVLPHLSSLDIRKLLKKINKFKLSDNSHLIFGFLDSGSNILKLSQQVIINDIFKKYNDDFKFYRALDIFKENFKRFKKFGFRNPINVFYDYFVNYRSYGISHFEILNSLSKFSYFSSYPYILNDINFTPITYNYTKKLDYNYFFFQQLHWFNNFDLKNNFKNEFLFEKYEKALAKKKIKEINFFKKKINSKIYQLKKIYNQKLNLMYKEFGQFNNLVEFVFNEKFSLNKKIIKIKKSRFYKSFSGIGTCYVVLKKK